MKIKQIYSVEELVQQAKINGALKTILDLKDYIQELQEKGTISEEQSKTIRVYLIIYAKGIR